MTEELTLSGDNSAVENVGNADLINTVQEMDLLIDHNKKNGWPSLNANQRVFAHNFLVHRTIGKAAKETGISSIMGGKFIRNPVVSAFVKHLQELQAIRFSIDSDFATMELLEAMEKFKGEVDVPMIDSDGMQFHGRKFHPEQYMAVLKELNKISGLNNQSVTGGPGGVTIKIDMGTMCSRPMDIEVKGDTYENE